MRGIDSPAFLCLSPDGRFLYAASEVPGRSEGIVGAYAVSPADGTLTDLGAQGMGGAWASYLSTDAACRALLLADYGVGRVALLPILADGRLGPVASAHQLQGSGPDPERQGGPHTHCLVAAPDGRYAFAADLGADRVFGFRLDPTALTLEPAADLQVTPGSGSRHLVFGPGGRGAYLLCELAATIETLAYDPDLGVLRPIGSAPLLPASYDGPNMSAEIRIHPSGRFLYASNRGHDSLTMFAIEQDGRLRLLGHRDSEGRTPRSFAISPDGRFLIVANQDSHVIVTMPIDPETGELGATSSLVETPTPACLVFGRI